MSKSAVTRLFVGGVIAVIAGLVLGFIAVWAAFANGAFVMDGPDVTGISTGAFPWAMVALVTVAIVAVIGGAMAGLVSWIGALLNTAQLADKTWFVLVLVLGVVSLGFVAMIAYVIAGPDGTAPRPHAGAEIRAAA
jgi:hypothetical protein